MSDLRTLPDGRTTGTTDEGIEYGFMMAKWLGVEAISTSTQVSMAKRIAPFADKHNAKRCWLSALPPKGGNYKISVLELCSFRL